jgi:hypothetical protein
MEQVIVGIDVSKDQLDVAVRPSGEAFVVARNAAGLEELVQRLAGLAPHLVALEATGGFETVVAAWGRPFCRSPWSTRHRSVLSPSARQKGQSRPDRRCRDRPFRRGDQPRAAAAAG